MLQPWPMAIFLTNLTLWNLVFKVTPVVLIINRVSWRTPLMVACLLTSACKRKLAISNHGLVHK